MVPPPLAHPNPPQPFGNGLFELETSPGNSLNHPEGIGHYPSSASLYASRYHLSVHVKGSRFRLPVEENETKEDNADDSGVVAELEDTVQGLRLVELLVRHWDGLVVFLRAEDRRRRGVHNLRHRAALDRAQRLGSLEHVDGADHVDGGAEQRPGPAGRVRGPIPPPTTSDSPHGLGGWLDGPGCAPRRRRHAATGVKPPDRCFNPGGI